MSKITMAQLKLLKPYAKNPRKNQPVDDVASSIKEYGFTNPILIDKDNNIIAGHTRYKAAQQLKLKTVPCVVLDLPKDKIKAYRLLDNKLGEKAGWDTFLFETELQELIDTGFDIEKWDLEFTLDDNEPEVKIIEPETNQKHERFKQLVFLYEDVIKYADHFKRIQAIKYELGYDTDDQIIETLLEVYSKNK
ncbi:MAG: hypothetical protein GOVbin4691_7 [Prokaryotic dsDNA virus sp.]|jgi:hypothetical protein|nr:chromosome partitioning protein ParB [Candidatus Pacearchaeota archaeon]QDP52515.1 MAG: hypothetical protein GOVbin4691_7 [Prokaryotic dsDNA virus sp.]|tara:strand:+ start:1187 stop:1762 length:576 start_codon:yes stop_codon:yes gene_type:complete